MLPTSPEVCQLADWTRRTKTEPILLMELFPLRHLQFEQLLSQTPAYGSDRLAIARVSDRLSSRDIADLLALGLKRHLSASCGSPSVHRVSKKL
jgi:hypothetical protein